MVVHFNMAVSLAVLELDPLPTYPPRNPAILRTSMKLNELSTLAKKGLLKSSSVSVFPMLAQRLSSKVPPITSTFSSRPVLSHLRDGHYTPYFIKVHVGNTGSFSMIHFFSSVTDKRSAVTQSHSPFFIRRCSE